LRSNITALPVWNKEKKQFVGEIDSFDILDGMVLSKEDSDVGIVDNFGDGTVQDLLYLKYLPLVSQEHPDSDGLAVFNPTESVESVVRTLKWRHRCLVRQDHASLNLQHRMITQSDLINYIFTHRGELSPAQQTLLKTRLDNCGLANPAGSPYVITCPEDLNAFDAFRLLKKSKVSALAIVNARGELVGNLSASNIRGTDPRLILDALKLPVIKFLEATGRRFHPVTAVPTDNVESVIQRIVAARIHRVWIVNSAFAPIGVISLGDLLGQIVEAK
jgi:CBS domain-containing protein